MDLKHSHSHSHSPSPSISTSPSFFPSFPPFLLLLSDSALPLGSFAFSSGLESYLAHHNHNHNHAAQAPSSSPSPRDLISCFLSLSLTSIATSALPYLIAAYRSPSSLRTLDNDLDASTPCTVARRASIAQGRALLGVWEKAYRQNASNSPARDALADFASSLKDASTSIASVDSESMPTANGHLAPLFGVVCLTQALSLADTIWVFLFSHARAVLSAAIRAGAMGPYQSQAVLASEWLMRILRSCMDRGLATGVESAGQCVPALDVWQGRHEKLYTRIFNS